MNRFVIVGTGRSGTRFTAHLLRGAGINCGHEDVFTFKHVLRGQPLRWGNWEADSSWMAVPMLHKIQVPSFLVVREPLAVVKSMLELGWFRHDKRLDIAKVIYRFRPEIRSRSSRPDRCLALWYQWNLAALEYVDRLFRLEDLEHTGGAGLLEAVWHKQTGIPRFPYANTIAAIRNDPVKANLKRDVPRESWDVNWKMFSGRLAAAALTLRHNLGYRD